MIRISEERLMCLLESLSTTFTAIETIGHEQIKIGKELEMIAKEARKKE